MNRIEKAITSSTKKVQAKIGLGSTNFGEKIWPLIKKEKDWAKAAKQLEQGYDESLKNELIDAVIGNISRYGLGEPWK